MNSNVQARLIATLIIGVLGGIALHAQIVNQIHMTRAQFLFQQGIRYDRLNPSLPVALIGACALALLVIGCYELVVIAIMKAQSIGTKSHREQGG